MANLLQLQWNFNNGTNKRLNNIALASLGIKVMNKPIYSDLLQTYDGLYLYNVNYIHLNSIQFLMRRKNYI